MPVTELEAAQPAPVPQLLVELPSRRQVFLTNLNDLLRPQEIPPLQLRSAPAPFWHDVFVQRDLPWPAFVKSSAFHAAACILLVAFTHLLALQPRVVATPEFDRSQVVCTPSEYLPPLDTRETHAAQPRKADPEFARQAVISVPRESDNRAQTIVTPPNVKMKRDLALPNIVAWSDTPQKPRLYIPPAPLTLAADISRLSPKTNPQLNSVVTPPPDASHLTHHREQPTLQAQVVAPPELVERTLSTTSAPQAAVIAPPPTAEFASNRPLGELNISRNSVIAPAPSLPVAEQRTIPGGRSSRLAAQVVPPPPSAPASGSFGAQGRVIALNLHPAAAAPPTPPSGNRRGSFSATPEGHAGATGSPGAASANGKENASGSNGSNKKSAGNLPAGLYVGSAAAKSSAVAGDPASSTRNSVNSNLLASARPLRLTPISAPHSTQSDASKLTEPERAIFGNRKFYSLTLNMPNLNSAGGSWVIRFAELNHESNPASSDPTHTASSEPGQTNDLSQPQATRKVDPAYPLELMRENVNGTVILYAVIHADGTVASVRILRGIDPRLDKFASEAVAQWRFSPATKNGAAVAVEATFQIPFHPTRLSTNF